MVMGKFTLRLQLGILALAISSTVMVLAENKIKSTTQVNRSSASSKTVAPFIKSSTSRIRTTGKSTSRRPYTTSSNKNYYYYYMNDYSRCSNLFSTVTKYLNGNDVVFVRAWSSSRAPLSGGCKLTFATSYGMKFRFSPSYYSNINDHSVTLKIYSGTTRYNTRNDLWKSYSYWSSFSTSYYYTHDGYVTIELLNDYRSTNFDFQFEIRTYTYSDAGEIAGITVGVVVFCLMFACVFVIVCCRRRRMRLLTTTTTTTYPTGQAGYPPSYGSVTTATATTYPPPPPPGAYPAGSTNYGYN